MSDDLPMCGEPTRSGFPCQNTVSHTRMICPVHGTIHERLNRCMEIVAEDFRSVTRQIARLISQSDSARPRAAKESSEGGSE